MRTLRRDVLGLLVAVTLAPLGGSAAPTIPGVLSSSERTRILDVDSSSGEAHYELQAPISIPSLRVEAFGLSCRPEALTGHIDQGGTFTYTFDLEHAGNLIVTLIGPVVADLDLAVYGPSGRLVAISDHAASSAERITIRLPADGRWRIEVVGRNVPAGWAEFDLSVDAIEGRDLEVVPVPSGPYAPGDRITVELRLTRFERECAEPRALLVWGSEGDEILDEAVTLRTRRELRAAQRLGAPIPAR
jgi:hypothetical protein